MSIELGLVLSLIILVAAVRAPLTPGEKNVQVHLQTQEVVNMEDITQTEQQTKAPPPPRAPVPVEVPDNTVLEQEEINFDASLDLSDTLSTAGPPMPDEPESQAGEGPSKNEIFVVVEEQPKLIGGMAALRKRVNYPSFAEKAGIQGRVFVEFVVDEEGNVQNPSVTRGVHKLLNEEALRAVKGLRFVPGKQRGKPVKVQLTLPVNFHLEDAE